MMRQVFEAEQSRRFKERTGAKLLPKMAFLEFMVLNNTRSLFIFIDPIGNRNQLKVD